jgi:hypothetical protein
MVHKVKVKGEVQRYTVQAMDENFAVCTKPFNARSTYLYFIADFKSKRRGPSNWSWGFPFDDELDTKAGGEALLLMLNTGEAHFGRRGSIPMDDDELSQFQIGGA